VKLDSNELYKRKLEELFREMGQYGVVQLGKRAPKGETRLLANSNKWRFNPATWTLILTNDATSNGFRYGFALNAGKAKRKSGTVYEYHRRRTGRPTTAWFSGLRNSTRNRIRANIKKVARAIEGTWSGK